MLKCRIHLQQALLHNESPKVIPWVGNYFLAKIAEKLGDPMSDVFDLYHRSAMAMERDGFTYPPKVSRSKQINFEPLEIHYKVHSYALKMLKQQLKEIEEVGKQGLSYDALGPLTEILAQLKRFGNYGVEKGQTVIYPHRL